MEGIAVGSGAGEGEGAGLAEFDMAAGREEPIPPFVKPENIVED